MPQRASSRGAADAGVRRVTASAFRIPTDRPESDGTFTWDATTLVLVEITAADTTGTGYSYTDASAVGLVRDVLSPAIEGLSPLDIPHAWLAMQRACRNLGRAGVVASAIAAVDAALWDLKARLLGVSLLDLIGAVRASVPVYGSGGFTSYTIPELEAQLVGWVEAGIRSVKMKVGRDHLADVRRVRAARQAIGLGPGLFVDANGAWTPSRACQMARTLVDAGGVSWFEEPVSSDDIEGLITVRTKAPLGCEIAAGEYGYTLSYFRRMLACDAVDVLQADATRCAGITGFLQAGHLCEAFHTPLSAHTAPALHASPACALPRLRHVEYFHDHVRIERRLFDGGPRLIRGALAPDRSAPGLGLTFKHADAAEYRVA